LINVQINFLRLKLQMDYLIGNANHVMQNAILAIIRHQIAYHAEVIKIYLKEIA